MRRVFIASLFGLLAIVIQGVAEDPAQEDAQILKANNLPLSGSELLEYLRKRSAKQLTEKEIGELVEQMGDDCFFKRQDASLALSRLGSRSRPYLQKALNHEDLEIRIRATRCLRDIGQNGIEAAQVDGAVLRELGRARPPGLTAVLLDFLAVASEDEVVETARQTLADVGVKDGKADAALVRALSDKQANRRLGAGIALCRAGGGGRLPEVQKLLSDESLDVRLTLALELAALKRKEAVPVLIASLTEPDSRLTGLAEDLLFRLAGENAPRRIDKDPKRQKYQQAWDDWWKKVGGTFDESVLAGHAKVVGHTTVVLLDQDEVVDLDAGNRIRWKVGGLRFPLDVQRLPKERILVAEYRGARVVELGKKGEVVWEHAMDEPIVAQRLANGNTFMANRFGLREVDATGKEVFSHVPMPRNWVVMRARKLPDGDMLVVLQSGGTRLVRMDKNGKELKSFDVEVGTSGGKIDLTPSGTVLIPEMYRNRVVERDLDGKEIRVINIDSPVIALSLPNGHMIITSNTENRAVELDREGREVWQYKRNTRVTRAVRH